MKQKNNNASYRALIIILGVVIMGVIVYYIFAQEMNKNYPECGGQGGTCVQCAKDCRLVNGTLLHSSHGGFFNQDTCTCIINGTVQSIW